MPFEEGSVNLLSLLVLLTNVFAFLLIIFLWIGRSKENSGNFFLSLVILQCALWVFPEFLYLLGLLDNFPHAVRIYVIGSLLIGPVTYFYVRTSTEKEFRLTPKMSWHFVPVIFDFIFQLPFYTLAGEDKLAYFNNFFLEGSSQQPLWLTLFKILHILCYLLLSIRIVINYKNHLNNRASLIDVTFHRWLFLFCLALIVQQIGAFIFNIINADAATAFVIGWLFMVIATAFSLLIIKPSLFGQFPHQMSAESSKAAEKRKYENSKLKSTEKDKYVEDLQRYIAAYKPFLEPELTLTQLAEKVKIPMHHLSQVINEKLDSNFMDFINSYRVKAAQELLVDPKLSHYTIVSIAYEAGFSAKSTFYAVFKKHAGMTPSQYRKQVVSAKG